MVVGLFVYWTHNGRICFCSYWPCWLIHHLIGKWLNVKCFLPYRTRNEKRNNNNKGNEHAERFDFLFSRRSFHSIYSSKKCRTWSFSLLFLSLHSAAFGAKPIRFCVPERERRREGGEVLHTNIYHIYNQFTAHGSNQSNCAPSHRHPRQA